MGETAQSRNELTKIEQKKLNHNQPPLQ